ncbi:MAG: helix-turn-helix transcriptional regulator [Cyanobacteria bacterium P01_D01_bin.115]
MLKRKASGLTQRQLADEVGVDPTTIQRWERGASVPTLNPLQFWRLCQLLKCTAEDLARDFFPEAFSDESGAIAAESPGVSPN